MSGLPELCQRTLLQLWEIRLMEKGSIDAATIQDVRLAWEHFGQAYGRAKEAIPASTKAYLDREGMHRTDAWKETAESHPAVRLVYQLDLVRHVIGVLLEDLQPLKAQPPADLKLGKMRR